MSVGWECQLGAGSYLKHEEAESSQWVARNSQGGCGWEFPCTWSRQIIAKLIANRILNKLQSFQKKGHTKTTGKVVLFFFLILWDYRIYCSIGGEETTLLGMAPFLTLIKKLFQPEFVGVDPIISGKTWLFSGLHADSTNFVLLVSTKVSLILVQATDLTYHSWYLQK